MDPEPVRLCEDLALPAPRAGAGRSSQAHCSLRPTLIRDAFHKASSLPTYVADARQGPALPQAPGAVWASDFKLRHE